MVRLLLPLTGDLGPAFRLLVLGLTYLSHSLLWAAAAALLTRSRRLAASTNSSMWKMALFGPLLTTALSATLWPALDRSYGGPLLVLLPQLQETSAASSDVLSMVGSAPARDYWLGESFWRWVVVACVVAGLVGLSRFVKAVAALSENLRDRQPSTNARVQHLLQGLLARTSLKRVRVTESTRLTSPVSIGLGEICIPRRLFETLTDAEAEAILAHEAAHLERRDGIWFPAVAFLESIFWIYPLTRWVSKRLRYCAELACDDRAVALTEQPRALAHALARVAERALALRGASLLPSIADASGPLLRRVQRLVSADAGRASTRSVRGSGWALACAVVCGCSLSAISLDLPEGESSPGFAALAPIGSGAQASASVEGAEAKALWLEIAGLEVREREVEAELESLSGAPLVSSSGAPSPRLLELEQELRHSRAMRAFLGTRLTEPGKEVR